MMNTVDDALNFYVAIKAHDSGITDSSEGPYWSLETAELAKQQQDKEINHHNFYTEIVRKR
jgi:hypothetical protein